MHRHRPHRPLVNIVPPTPTDHDGRARERADRTVVDAAHTAVDGDGVLLPRRLRTRLRVHDPRARDGALRVLERQVRASFTQAFTQPALAAYTLASGRLHIGLPRHFTRPDVPQVAYPEGFQGNEIPIDGAAVARLVRERLTLAEEMDD